MRIFRDPMWQGMGEQELVIADIAVEENPAQRAAIQYLTS